MWHRLKTYEIRGAPVPALSKEESQVVHLQGIGGGLLVPGQDYLLWFTFDDAQPRKVAIAVRLLPVGSFNEESAESVGGIMKEGAQFKPEVLAKMIKAQKDEKTADGAKADSTKLEPTKPDLVKPEPTKPDPTPGTTPPDASTKETSPKEAAEKSKAAT